MDYYFGSYAESEIHESMLKDRTRTEAYRDFIYHNKDYFKDKIVLDVGCGTGILSMFAAKAGAKKVFAVDNSTIINKAKRIVKDNGLDQIITFVQGKVEEISLPVEHVDIIISEWMGYFLLYEGMLDSVLHARDRWLRPNTGLMAPSRTDILLTAIQDEEWINDKYHFWNEVYGFNMAVMKRGFLNDGCVDHYDPDMIVADVQTVKRIDIGSTTVADLDFTSPITLTATKDARVNGLLGWFDTFFTARDEAGNATSSPEQIEDVTFSTGPYTTPTHWKQTAFPFEHALEVRKGETISGTFECRKHSDNHRELTVIVDVCVRDAEGSVRDGSAVRKEYIVR
ncbi:S-adenosyl-L-methionine-dependent methyltransferase [Fimicolochytrium jonesii]|uniref:S-adenosyl-L-methionine-dependent methyltransferase n=1 Tax=Fimicolochytrium jonesii TaxID=1396493 RepID=UPI0022FEF2DD|nr:S-adenosyl-L-methionine-dependent methyltransferase [Fimicolochytrium jonesii]KAI8819499.1 S-adenosyl-L-methionine-dependent methyltransferase [Fimicolochytrium jonesii]